MGFNSGFKGLMLWHRGAWQWHCSV